MAYRILYGTDILWEPYSDNTDAITDATMSVNVNAAKYLDFTMPPTHSLYNVIAERDKLIRLYANDKLIYKGYITKITLDMEGYKQVNCSSVMSYLGDTHVRDYSTIEGEQPLKAPTSLDGLFQWYIDQHNKHCMDSNKRFIVGVNQAGALDENNYVYRSSTQFPTTSSEIEEKILNLGGYIFERYEDDNNILDFYADAHEANTQILDFGVNITDFTHERSGEDQYTAIYATGYTPDPPEDDPEKKMRPISLADIQNGGSPYSPDLFKLGDVLYSISGVQHYGYREYYYSNDDITTTDYLLKAAGVVLTKLLAPTITLDVKAIDMALFMENGYEHLQLGQAVRVRSKPHNIDEYLMISGIDLDLQDPGQTTYTIGSTYDTLTGQQSSYLKSLNSGINSSLDSVAALDKATKENAKGIDEAKKDAANATSKANEASNKADVATNTANNANTKANEAKADAANANTKSDTATETANSASQNAQKAQEAAAAATSNAKDAVTAAGKATEIANSANTKSEQATDLANSANQAASTASSIASEAKKTAENAKAAAEEGVAAAKDAASKAQVAADKAQADANANTKAVAQAQSAADAAKKAAADAQEKAENVESNLESANAVIEQHSNKLGELSTKVSNAVTNADAALTASTEAKQTATEASTMANTAYEDSQTAITNSTKATQTATEAKTTAESAVTTANDSLKQSSSAVQTANRIQNTLTTDYQTKADSDLLYATKSSLTETSESIKMEVSANYATKSTVEALKNVADNAIESWRGSGVPTSENKPASDWTTTEEKKRHSGDLYYDKDTGKAYRWGSDDGIVYSWVLNQDTDITKALQDASNAQKSADNAQTTANGAVTAAGNAQKSADGAQSTANSAKTAAANAQKTADTVQTDVDQLKIDIPNTYATKASLETTANSITAQVESVSTTANSAVTAASKAQQTADAINVNLTKNYQTKENADNTYATKATLTATSESLSTSITKAQQTADGAVNAASNAQQTADAININLSKNYQTAKDADDKYATQTSLNATAESIRSEVSTTYATKTDVTDAVDGLANTVETTYSTKSEVKQLSDQVSSTVTEVSTVKNDLSAAKKVADDAALAASKAQQTANDAKTDAATAQSAADTAKANAAAAQSKADEAANNLAAAEENLNNLQSQADATDEQVASAQTAVENAKKAADAAQADATTAKNAAATAQSIANTAKANAATAQSTADTAKANAKTAQDDVNALKNRVTTAETSIKQNSDAIALRATKTEVTSAIDGISVGGRNLLLGTAAFNVTDISNMDDEKNGLNNSDLFRGNRVLKYNTAWHRYYIFASKFVKKYNLKGGEFVTYSIWFKFTTNDLKDTDSKVFNVNGYNGASKSENFYTKIATLNVVTDADVWRQYSFSFKIPEDISEADNQIRIQIDYFTEPDYTSPRLTQWWSSPKLEFGNKPTDWSPAPEDLASADDVTNLTTRVTNAETKIEQNSEAIKLRATKTDVMSTIDSINVGGRNLIKGSAGAFERSGFNNGPSDISWQTGTPDRSDLANLTYMSWLIKQNSSSGPYFNTKRVLIKDDLIIGDTYTLSFWAKCENNYSSTFSSLHESHTLVATPSITVSNTWKRMIIVFEAKVKSSNICFYLRSKNDLGRIYVCGLKLERGNKATDWSPAPEDLVAESKTYTDAQMKITSDSITSTVSKTYATKTDLAENYTTTVDMNSKIEQTANSIKSEVSEVYQPKGDYAIKSEVDQTIEGVETKITTVTNTANAAQTATNTLNTLIRQSGNGVEVAKKVNGAYTSTKTLMGSDGFYVKDDSGNNLTQIKPSQAIIGKAESKNVLVNSNGINIRNGENTIASFSEDIVELGKNSKSSVINMCNKNGSIEVVADDSGDYGENFTITGKSGAAIRYQALMEDPYHEGYYIPYEKAEVYTNKRVGNAKVKEAGMYVFDKTYGHASMRVLVNEPIYGNNCASIGADNIYLTADKSVTINGSGILNVKKSLYIQDNIVSDFVVAEGKCDFWTYRMWNSGIAECWGHTSQTTVSVTSEWGYLYDSGTGHTNGFPGNTTESSALKFNVTIGGKKYTKLFTSVEHCDCNFISSDNAFMIETGSGLSNLKTPQVFLLRATSADVTGKFSYHAIGRWKA